MFLNLLGAAKGALIRAAASTQPFDIFGYRMNTSPTIDYECFEELIRRLRVEDHAQTANKLDFMLHRVAWTTGSELIGELGLEILAFRKRVSDISAELQHALEKCLSMVRTIWPDFDGTAGSG